MLSICCSLLAPCPCFCLLCNSAEFILDTLSLSVHLSLSLCSARLSCPVCSQQNGVWRSCGCINRPGYGVAESALLACFIPVANHNTATTKNKYIPLWSRKHFLNLKQVFVKLMTGHDLTYHYLCKIFQL